MSGLSLARVGRRNTDDTLSEPVLGGLRCDIEVEIRSALRINLQTDLVAVKLAFARLAHRVLLVL